MPQTNNQRNPQSRRVARRFSPRAAAALFILILIIAATAIIVIKVNQWRNDGERYAAKLAEQIGVSPETAEKYAKVTLSDTSAYACVNMAMAEGAHLFESKKSVEVSGVNIPEWVIFTGTTNNVVTDVTFYDYRQLKKYGNGVQTSAHVDASGINTSMDSATVQEFVGFAPFCTKHTTDGIVETYKYYYEDKNTGDTVSYLLHVTYKDGKAVSAAEQENYFILSVLTLE